MFLSSFFWLGKNRQYCYRVHIDTGFREMAGPCCGRSKVRGQVVHVSQLSDFTHSEDTDLNHPHRNTSPKCFLFEPECKRVAHTQTHRQAAFVLPSRQTLPGPSGFGAKGQEAGGRKPVQAAPTFFWVSKR